MISRGKVEIETLYGQDPETRQWRCPLKEQLGVAGRLPLSPLLARRLCFTATQSLSFAACARTARSGARGTQAAPATSER